MNQFFFTPIDSLPNESIKKIRTPADQKMMMEKISHLFFLFGLENNFKIVGGFEREIEKEREHKIQIDSNLISISRIRLILEVLFCCQFFLPE